MVDFETHRLSAWLTANIQDFSPPFSLDKFAGGQSNPTYLLTAADGRYVLRRKPFGPLLPSAHAIEREFRLLSALFPTGFPIPAPLGLCEDAEVIGAPFYVMAFREGRNFVDATLSGMHPRERRAIYDALVDNLAHLHSVDPGVIGLQDYGRPGNYFERQVTRWTKQYRASQTETIKDMEWLIDHLAATVPKETTSGIVHGDYRIDNLIFDNDGPEIRATLDWELSTLGDPLADFSYLAMNWATPPDGRSGLAGLDLAGLGIPDLEEMTERYADRRGIPLIPNLNWYFAFNQFRLAGIMQGIKMRVEEGNASSEQAAQQAARVPATAALARTFAEKG